MPGLTLEQELVLIARGVAELAEALTGAGVLEGHPRPGIDFARGLRDAADAGLRGLSLEQQLAQRVPANGQKTWPTPPPPPPKPGIPACRRRA
jgi:hypothetical protein